MRRIALCLGAVLLASGCSPERIHEPPNVPLFVIKPTVATLQVGQDSQFVAIVVWPEPTRVSWRSDFPEVASVDSAGVVTAHGRGGTYIIARFSPAGLTREDTASVTVR